MHVLYAVLYLEVALKRLAVDLFQFGKECRQFILFQQADALQHGDVRHGAKHVVLSQIQVQFAVAAYGILFYLGIYLKAFVPEFCHIVSL